MFHDLPVRWGAHHPLDPRLLTNQYYEHYLPRTLKRLAKIQPVGELFDAIVVDEGQDFGALWWESVLVCLKDAAAGGLYVFMDDDQRIFGREGRPPIEAPPFVLNENLRNTKQIAALSGALSTELAIPRGLSGPRIRLVEASAGTVIERADDAVNQLIEREGWSPQQVALLTTKRKHPVQQQDVDALGWRGYWDAFFDDKDVFYGNVLGFERTGTVRGGAGGQRVRRSGAGPRDALCGGFPRAQLAGDRRRAFRPVQHRRPRCGEAADADRSVASGALAAQPGAH